MSQLVMTYPVIGWSKYSFNGQEGLRLFFIEQFEQGDRNGAGSFQTVITAPYTEASKLVNVSLSLDAPANIEVKCRLVNRGGKVSLVCDEILKITPTVKPKESKDNSPKPN
jgi:hypothetical protein